MTVTVLYDAVVVYLDHRVMIYVGRSGTVPLYCNVPRQPPCEVRAAPPLIRIIAKCGRAHPFSWLKNTPSVWFELVREHGFKGVNHVWGTGFGMAKMFSVINYLIVHNLIGFFFFIYPLGDSLELIYPEALPDP